MDHALPAFFAQVLGSHECHLEDLLDGRLINRVLVHTDPLSFSNLTQDNVVHGVWKQIEEYYHRTGHPFCKDQVDILALALSGSLKELVKLLKIVLGVMIESKRSDEYIGVILDLPQQHQEQMKVLVQGILGPSHDQIPDGLDQNERRVLLDKIDELEQENNTLQEQIKDYDQVKARLHDTEMRLEQESIKMEKLLSQAHERTSHLQEENYTRTSNAMRERITELEEHYKILLQQKQQEKEQLAIELDKAQQKRQETRLKQDYGSPSKSNKAAETEKIQEMFMAYKADQEELNEKQRAKQQVLKSKLAEEKEKCFQLECELSGLKGVVLQMEQDEASMKDRLRRKENLIEELYERRAQVDTTWQLDEAECTEAIQRFESNFDKIIGNTQQERLDQQLQYSDRETERQDIKALKTELKQMKESMQRLMVDNAHWKMKDNKARQQQAQEEAHVEALKEELRKQKYENIELLGKQKEENIRLMKEVALREEQQRDLRQAQETGRMAKESLQAKQEMCDQLYAQLQNERGGTVVKGEEEGLLQKLRQDVDKYKKHCEAIRKIKVKEIETKDQELKFLVSVLFELRTKMNRQRQATVG